MDIKILKEAALKFGTPIYLYDLKIIKNQFDILNKELSVLENYKIHFAAKSLSNISILKYIKKMGAGLDAVSIEEVMIGLKCGFNKDEILYTPNGVSFKEIKEVFKLGVKINLDSIESIKDFVDEFGNQPITVRINPGIYAGGNDNVSVGHSESKFGIPEERIDELLDMENKGKIKITGLHIHTGSDIEDINSFLKACDFVFEQAEGFKELEFLDFGSGFKVKYFENDSETDVIELGKRRDELIDSVLPVVNLRGKNDKVIIVNPNQTYAPALIEFLEVNTDTITLNADHQKFNEFAKLERRIARTMGDNNQKLSQLETNFNKLKMDEIKYDRNGSATAENSIKATIDSFATKALIQEMQMVLKDSNSTSLRDYWDCFMSCSLANIFNPSSAMSRVEDMDLHVQEIKVKAQNEIMKRPKDDAIFVRIIKKVTDEFQKLRNTCDSLKECLIMTEEFEVLTYKRLNHTLELITSLGTLYIKKHIQNEVQVILKGISKIDDKVGGDSIVEKNKWDATREVLEQIIFDTTSVSNGTNNREGSNNNDKVLFTKRGSPSRKAGKAKNSNLPEISRGDLKQLLQDIRKTLKIGKLTSAKRYKDQFTYDAVISNVEVVCRNSQQSLPQRWCHYCGDDHMMRKCEEK